MDIETKERIRGWLVGVHCTAVDYYGGLPSIHFGQYLLSIGSAWRVTQGAEIVAASDSTDEVKAQLPSLIVGRVVTDLRIEGSFHDLLVDFAGECSIQSFADA